MSAYVNRKQTGTAADGAQTAIPLNRWANDDYTLVVGDTGSTSHTLEGTVDQINREDVTPVWFTLVDNQGTSLSGLTATGTYVVAGTPLEAVRINLGASTDYSFHVMQSGAC